LAYKSNKEADRKHIEFIPVRILNFSVDEWTTLLRRVFLFIMRTALKYFSKFYFPPFHKICTKQRLVDDKVGYLGVVI